MAHPTTAEVPIRLPTNRSKGLSVPWYKGSQPKRWVKVYPPGNCSHVSIGWFSGFPSLVRDMWSTNWLRLVPGKVNTWKQTLNTTKFVDVLGPVTFTLTGQTVWVSDPQSLFFYFLRPKKVDASHMYWLGGITKVPLRSCTIHLQVAVPACLPVSSSRPTKICPRWCRQSFSPWRFRKLLGALAWSVRPWHLSWGGAGKLPPQKMKRLKKGNVCRKDLWGIRKDMDEF